jgi:catechol 2,3-dioxygenase-like lactoylglutathione lyase family enzyme
MAQLRSLTIKAREPARLADFYRAVFELKTVSEDANLIRLSDGFFTLALLKEGDQALTGIHASGFHVDNLESVKQKAEKGGAASPHSEFQVMDPDKNLIDLSTHDFGTVSEKTPYPIRHLALFTADPRRLANFYDAALELKEVDHTDRGSIFVSDGYFNLALLYQRVREEKNGFNHFGIKIGDVEETRDRAEKAGVRRGAARPQRIPFAEFRLHDPEGNGIDISVKGFMPGET